MDLISSVVWFAIALCFITAIVTKIARASIMSDPTCTRPLPPVVNGIALLVLSPTLFKQGLKAMIHDLYTKFGSVFTISLFGVKVTFLVGPKVSAHFFQGLESEISHGNTLEFTVPMFGQGVGYGVDSATRNEQNRFYSDTLKPSKFRHVDPMVQEVEIIMLSASANKLSRLKEQAEEYAALIMEELDPEGLGYIEG